ncbi:MAG: ATP-binding cassette domain-containing protein [Armatimonadetes bacterium]|nr:ATP-binding cassette domain-containing protein [Armatimonadota bacterium]NIM23993.1 ATP-binding cassette domain-containing protein [Armatimonadota bacterium]NIM67843.1 ATP-binding cassette domain-containing protein [Armatimonadota bacterium]NIM76374.1 ATP-binding cassette domain-containing protein [Armatimonadota bacterium]NIN06073.1 ATP-binding cassette domain-containing protein [Armatimonadota bacterium]
MISIRNLSLDLGEFSLRDICLEIKEREYFVVLGETGAGKTLLIESVAGLLRPQVGEVWLAGRNVTNLRPEDRRVGYLPQDYALFPHLSVRDNIGFGMKVAKRAKPMIDSKVAQLANLLGITHLLERDVLHLSGGERQRTALARALAIDPEILLLDEPLSALDEQTRENLCGELRRVHERCGTTTVHISHSFEETLALADRIAVINAGQVEQVGIPTEVMSRPASEFVASFVRCQNILRGRAYSEAELTRIEVDGTEVCSDYPAGGAVTITVRPEEIALSEELPSQGKPNLFRGEVTMVVDRGAVTRVDVTTRAKVQGSKETPASLRLVALCTHRQGKALGLTPGKELYISFRPSVVHVIRRNQDEANT